jgi:hypothetical protein
VALAAGQPTQEERPLSTDQKRALIARLREKLYPVDSELWTEDLQRLTIADKRARTVKLQLNAIQCDILQQLAEHRRRGGQSRILVLKARQLGVSTLVQGLAYAFTRHLRRLRALTVSHTADSTEQLYRKQKLFQETDKSHPPTVLNSMRLVEFADTGSTHRVETAGAKAPGRGETFQFVHLSELAYWNTAQGQLKGLLEALGPEAICIAESTPNGVGGEFYDLWTGAPGNGWLALFYPWWWDEEYRLDLSDQQVLDPAVGGQALTDEEEALTEPAPFRESGLTLQQIAWRRQKVAELKDDFTQEYPEDPVSCFLSANARTVVPLARLRECQVPHGTERRWEIGSLVQLGVDVAGSESGDESVIREIRGMRACREWKFRTADSEELAGEILNIIQLTGATRVKVDSIGIGHGTAGRLKGQRGELHDAEIVAVNVSETAIAADEFHNQRSEMWWTLRNLVVQHVVDLTDVDEECVRQLVAARWARDGANRVQVEPKDKTASRIGRSPDNADALLLGYYNPPRKGAGWLEAWEGMAKK